MDDLCQVSFYLSVKTTTKPKQPPLPRSLQPPSSCSKLEVLPGLCHFLHDLMGSSSLQTLLKYFHVALKTLQCCCIWCWATVLRSWHMPLPLMWLFRNSSECGYSISHSISTTLFNLATLLLGHCPLLSIPRVFSTLAETTQNMLAALSTLFLAGEVGTPWRQSWCHFVLISHLLYFCVDWQCYIS